MHGELNFGRTPGAVGGTTLPNNIALTFPDDNTTAAGFTSVYFSQRLDPSTTLLAGKINIIDLYSAGQRFNGGRRIEGFQHAVFTAPPSGTVPASMMGAIASVKRNPYVFSGWVYDPQETMMHSGFDCLFCDGVTVRGTIDVASKPFGLQRKDSFTASTTTQTGTDFTTIPDLGNLANTPELRRDLIRAFIKNNIFGQDDQVYLPIELQPRPQEKGDRFYFSYAFEQTLWQNPNDLSDAWGLFGQIAVSDGNPNSIEWSAFGGVGGSSPIEGRSDDRFGIGAFYYGHSGELKDALDPLIDLGDAYGMEAYYNVADTKWFRVTMDLQVIAPAVKAQLVPTPGGGQQEDNSTVVMFGLRNQIKF